MRRCSALLVALTLAGCGGDSRSEAVEVEGQPGHVVEADGHKVYFHCEGEGSPTVVFLSGWGDDSSTWVSVFDQSSRMTRSCQYDRYGTGVTSQYGALPEEARDAHDHVRELEQLLENAGIASPYVLVGHSWGGALARLYAGTHDDVEAVVFLDSSTPEQQTAFRDALPPERAGEPYLFTALRTEDSDPLQNPENLDWNKSLDETGEVTSLGDRPEIVITAGVKFFGEEAILTPVWRMLQIELASLSSRSVHVLAPTSTHYIQTDAPELVLASVRAAVDAVRDGGQLGSCAAIIRRVDGKCLR